MSEFHINTEHGPHAAAELADNEVQYLCGLMLWELALRTDEADFQEFLERVAEQRHSNETELTGARYERDLMAFSAQVMLDIQSLPTTEDTLDEPGMGMYL